MRSLIYFPPRIHACVRVGCVEAVNIVIKWTPGNSHFYARLDYVKQERSTAAICIFWDSYITWASVALWFGSSTLGARADRLWLSAQTHTHTSNCCASVRAHALGETWAWFQFLPTRQSRKWVLLPVRARGEMRHTCGKGALETFGYSFHHNQRCCCNGEVKGQC